MHEAVKDDEALQQELIFQLTVFRDEQEALRCANVYNIDEEHWPHSLRQYKDNFNLNNQG